MKGSVSTLSIRLCITCSCFCGLFLPLSRYLTFFLNAPALSSGAFRHLLDALNVLRRPTAPLACPRALLFLEEDKSEPRIKFRNNRICVCVSSSSVGCVARSAETAAVIKIRNHELSLHVWMWEFLNTWVVYLFCNHLEFWNL